MKKTVINYQISVIVCLLFVACFLQLNTFAQKPKETPPPPSEPPSVNIPEIKETTLDNGLKVVVVPRRNLPLVTVSLLVKSGSNAEKPDKAGLASITAGLLTKGTEYRTATDIAEQIDFLGANLNTGAGWNSSTITLNVMKDKLGKAMSIMSDSVRFPSFSEKELQRMKKQGVDGLRVSMKQPGSLLGYVTNRYTFGTPVRTLETLKRIKRDDIVKLYSSEYKPANSILIFVGDVSATESTNYAKLFFGSWGNGKTLKDFDQNISSLEPKIQSETESKSKTINKILVVDLPNSGQAAVGFSKAIKSGRVRTLDSRLYYPATVLNSILGGGYSARLNQEIRLKRGLSYGAGSNFAWSKYSTLFRATTQTKNESAGQVAELIKVEIEKLVNTSIEDKEMKPRKAVVTGGFGRSLQTNSGLARRLQTLYLYNRKASDMNSFMKEIRSVSNSKIKEFASNNLLGGNMIIVGDAKMFMDDLKKRFPNRKIEVIKASELDLNSPTLRKRK